jgi:hypothetical protein
MIKKKSSSRNKQEKEAALMRKACDLFAAKSEEVTTVSSLVREATEIIPAFIQLDDDEYNSSNRKNNNIHSCCEDHVTFRAKITLIKDSCSDDHESSSTTACSSTSPQHHHRKMPCFPETSTSNNYLSSIDSTIDRGKNQPFMTQEIVTENDDRRCIGTIQIFRYHVFVCEQAPAQGDDDDEAMISNKLRQQRRRRRQPNAKQVQRLEYLATKLGQAIQNRQHVTSLEHDIQVLQEENRRLRESQTQAQIGQWELDLTATGGGQLYWSDFIFELFRVDKKRFPASYEAFLNAIHPDDRDKVDQAYRNSLETKQPYNISHRLLFPSSTNKDDGGAEDEIVWVREMCRTEYDEETGKPLYSIGVVQKISSS